MPKPLNCVLSRSRRGLSANELRRGISLALVCSGALSLSACLLVNPLFEGHGGTEGGGSESGDSQADRESNSGSGAGSFEPESGEGSHEPSPEDSDGASSDTEEGDTFGNSSEESESGGISESGSEGDESESESGCEILTWYRDADGDGYGIPKPTVEACDPPDGYVDNADDCNDQNEHAYPTHQEHCDGIDNDCDAQIDEYSEENLSCGGCFYRLNGSQIYAFCTSVRDWYQSRTDCARRGMDLVVINSPEENQWLYDSYPESWWYWIGLHDQNVEGEYEWVDDSALESTHWDGGQPDNMSGIEHCVEMTPGGLWNDNTCSDGANNYICEVTDESAP